MKIKYFLCVLSIYYILVSDVQTQTQNRTSSLSNNTSGISAQQNYNQQDQNLLSQQQQIIDQEVIQLKPKIITQRLTAKPKIITERILGEPKLITEQIIEPTRQRIVIEPRIQRTVEEIRPQYNQGQDQLLTRNPVTREVQYKNEIRQQTIDIQGDVVNNNFIVEPEVKRITTQVQFQPSQTIQKTLDPMVREAIVQNNETPKYYQVEGDVYITQPYIQPIQQRENVQIDWQQEQDVVIERNPITREPIYQSRQRTQNVSVPGNTYYTQKVTQPYINREEVEVQFVQEPTIQSESQPIVRDTQYSQSSSVQRNIVPYTVRDEIPVGVPTPVFYDVPVYQYVYEPVEEPCDPCCCDDNKNQLGNIDSIINSVEVEIIKGGVSQGPPVKIDEKEHRVQNKQQEDEMFMQRQPQYQNNYIEQQEMFNDYNQQTSLTENRLHNGISAQYNPQYYQNIERNQNMYQNDEYNFM